VTVSSEPKESREWLELGTSTVAEAAGVDCILDHSIRPVWPGASVCACAYPVRCVSGNNLPVHAGLERAPRGSVLVVDAGGDIAGYWGEVLTRAAMQKGLAGVVVNGGVRDLPALESLAFAVFAKGIGIRGTVKTTDGTVGEPVQLGQVRVEMGDLVLGDADGVLVLPSRAVAAALSGARARQEKERALFERIAAGESTVDIYGWRDLVSKW